MDRFISSSGATTSIAGIFGNFTFNPTSGGTQVGNRFVVNNAPTTNANTAVNQIVRTVDNTSLANTVRGIEVVSNAGSNTAGINTGLYAQGATFGLQAVSSGLAGGVLEPSAIYGESQGTTDGNILRLYSSTMTSAPYMAQFYHETSAYTGTGLYMDLGEGGGSFTGSFIDLQNAGATKFIVKSDGDTGIGTSTPQKELQVIGDIRVGTTGTNGCIEGFGGAALAGTCSSDENLKTNIQDIGNVLNKFKDLRVINFNWNTVASNLYSNDANATNTGYLAQNVESIFPELISINKEGYKQVNYTKLGLYAVEGVKELSIASENASTSISSLYTLVNSNQIQASSSLFNLSNIITANQELASSSLYALTNTVTSNYLESTSTFASLFNTTNNLQSQITNITNKINLSNAMTNAMTITSIGTIGIGNDGTQIGDELVRVSGRVRAQGFDIDSAADISEVFPADEALDQGTVVSFSTTTYTWNPHGQTGTSTDDYSMSGVQKASNGTEAIGVVTTKAGITLGSTFNSSTTIATVPIAFTGRVPVKVTTENGQIKKGDYITVSTTTPGYATKLTGEGKSIGIALSDDDGRGKVLMLVHTGYQKLDITGKYASTTSLLTTGNVDLNANGVAITNIKSLESANGTWSIDSEGRIISKIICVEGTCLNKDDVDDLLQIRDMIRNGAVPSIILNATSTNTSTDITPDNNSTTNTATETIPMTETSTESNSTTEEVSTSTEQIIETPSSEVGQIIPIEETQIDTSSSTTP